ncbi:MAG: DNA-protecting protein DprA [Arcobacteraceae bacterium]|nr:DNA-protecting protein DprA [Arcobacteraceae bacterium]
MINKINFKIKELDSMKKYPEDIYYIGNLELLDRPKISIVGTRKPISYTKNFTHTLSSKLSNKNITIVSGVAMGVDAIAHKASINSTIAVVANGLDIRYPAVNKNLIQEIENNSLIISTYKEKQLAKPYTFVQRNELVVALGDILIITQADLNSGSLRSAEFALKMGKQIYVLPHRIGDSDGTNMLLEKGDAKAIYDIDKFIEELGYKDDKSIKSDDFISYCRANPTYDEAVQIYKEKVFEYELLGEIMVEDGRIKVK